MDELTAWLRKQIERNKKAAEAATHGPWEIGDQGGRHYPGISIVGEHTTTHRYDRSRREFVQVPTRAVIIGPGYEGGGVWERADANHILRQQPKYTIARCEAELAELDALEAMPHYAWDGRPEYGCPMLDPDAYVGPVCTCGRDAFVARMLRVKAYGYRHREGWQEGWAP